MESCALCESDLTGDLGVVDMDPPEGFDFAIGVVEISNRNWICCDLCNILVCHTCAPHGKETGYCEKCWQKIYGTNQPVLQA